jgi:hypothetical protein
LFNEIRAKLKRFLPSPSVSLCLSISSYIHCSLLKNDFRFFGLNLPPVRPKALSSGVSSERGRWIGCPLS